jgi:hypothetical protein
MRLNALVLLSMIKLFPSNQSLHWTVSSAGILVFNVPMISFAKLSQLLSPKTQQCQSESYAAFWQPTKSPDVITSSASLFGTGVTSSSPESLASLFTPLGAALVLAIEAPLEVGMSLFGRVALKVGLELSAEVSLGFWTSLETSDGVLDGVLLGVLLGTWTAASLAVLLGGSLAVTLGVLLGAGLILTAGFALPDGAAFVVSAQNAKADARTKTKDCCFMTKYRSKNFLIREQRKAT